MIEPDHISQRLAAHVREARARAGLSRKRLADKAGVSERYLSQLEAGEANVSVGVLAKVAAALKVDLVGLLSPTVGMPSREPDSGPASPLAGLLSSMSAAEQHAIIPIVERFLADRRKSQRGIALLGLRGAGKSTIGGMFASRHRLPFLSVTREIEVRAGMSINDLFNLGGPDAYRTLENEVARELSSRTDRIVLETAGGIVSNAPAMNLILMSFQTVWLKASPEEHLGRVISQGDMRPMQSTPKALEHLKALLAAREQEYARADCVIDTTDRTPEACVETLEQIAQVVPSPS